MSWNMQVPNTDAANFLQALEDALPYGSGTHEEANAAEYCRSMARELFSNGRFGTPTAGVFYSASFSGHTYPDHQLTQGWLGESINFAIARVIPAAPVEAPLEVLAVTDTPAEVYQAIAEAQTNPTPMLDPATGEPLPYTGPVDPVTEPAEPVTEAPVSVTEPEPQGESLEENTAAGQLASESDAGTIS